MSDEHLQLDDLVYSYPDQYDPNIQTIISSKQEFRELASTLTEPPPPSGSLYRHQTLIQRYMLVYDRLLLIHRTGTGKSCAAFGTSEQFKISLAGAISDFILTYIKPQRTHIKHIYVLTRNELLVNELRYQLACKCTKGDYLTDRVENAKNDTEKRRALTIELRGFYTIEPYQKYVNAIIAEELTREQLRERYSNSMFIIDEVQNLHPKVDDEVPTAVKLRINRQLWDIFHSINYSKVMLLSATPMINDADDVISTMNLILPESRQMPSSIRTMSLDQLEPYFRGLVSYVREAETGAIPRYIGNRIPATFTVNNRTYESQVIIFNQTMSEHQTRGYLNATDERGGYQEKKQQAATFVFPDGSYGGKGFRKYVREIGKDQYQANVELQRYISNFDGLRTLSTKFASIISLCSETNSGNCFCFSNFVVGGGAELLGICFSYYGFEQFFENTSVFRKTNPIARQSFCVSSESTSREYRSIRIQPRPRFALITSETPDTRRATILELFNSYENRHGDYIKVIIGSPIARTGINLANVKQVHLVGPSWNQSNMYQAISRAIRATSHVDLIQEEKIRLAKENRDPSQAKIYINIYQHVAIPKEGGGDSIDIHLYLISEQKDVEIKRIERIMKQVAIDCQIHRQRNIRPTDIPNTSICDYAECNYKCFSPVPDTIDYSSYDILYLDNTILEIINRLKEIFTEILTVSLDGLYGRLSSYKPKYIDQALTYLIVNKIIINDQYGNPSYLQENDGLVYLQQAFPLLTNINNYPLTYYSQTLIGLNISSLASYVTSIQVPEQTNIINQILGLEPNNPQFTTLINQLNIDGRVKLLETSMSQYVENDGEVPDNIKDILGRYSKFIFSFHEPVSLLEEIRSKLENRGKARGRKPKATTTTRLQKVNPFAASAGDLEEVNPDTETELVYVHTLYLQTVDRTAYAVSARQLKAEGRLRLLKMSEDIGWRDLRPNDEAPVYNRLIQHEIIKLMAPFERNFDIYGIIFTADNKFRIRDRSKEVAEDVASDARTFKRSLVCTTAHKPVLLDILYRLKLDPPNNRNVAASLSLSIEQLRKYLQSQKISNVEDLNIFPLDKLRFYYNWLSANVTREDICNHMRSHFEQNNRILVL